MPNAKITVELGGVEAGCQECGWCKSSDKVTFEFPFCHRFQTDLSWACGRLFSLRCPACLAAEIKEGKS